MPRWVLLLLAIVIAADQLVKHAMLALVFDPPTRIAITGFLNLVPVWNSGVSFGLLGDDTTSRWLFVALAILIVIGLFLWLVRAGGGVVAFALVLVIGGALSNVADRIVYGAVIDYIDLHAFDFHWPAFNIADMAIVAGTAMLLYDGLFGAPRSLK
jgi:signal peptidase II